MRRTRNAKIVATLGPASSSPELIRQLFMTGVDVFRLNFSHGSHADHAERFKFLRALEAETGRPIAILADLQGPKLRVGSFAGGPVMLAQGQAFRLDLDTAAGNAQRVQLPHPEIFAALAPGAELLLDDGKLRLVVERCGADFADTRVAVGGRLSEHKGVNVPGVLLPITALTEKDRVDLTLALELGADWIALSFVQRPEDVSEARALIGDRAAIVVKLEKPAAVDCLDEIVALSDAVMVARGDLGVELPAERVPAIQTRLRLSRLYPPELLGETLNLAAIVCYTSSGHTSLRAARERPESPILSLTPRLTTARRLALVWGVHSVHTADVVNVDQMTQRACEQARRDGFAQAGQFIVCIAGMPFGTPGTTNLMRIASA